VRYVDDVIDAYPLGERMQRRRSPTRMTSLAVRATATAPVGSKDHTTSLSHDATSHFARSAAPLR
jgi:hypothetical protein